MLQVKHERGPNHGNFSVDDKYEKEDVVIIRDVKRAVLVRNRTIQTWNQPLLTWPVTVLMKLGVVMADLEIWTCWTVTNTDRYPIELAGTF